MSPQDAWPLRKTDSPSLMPRTRAARIAFVVSVYEGAVTTHILSSALRGARSRWSSTVAVVALLLLPAIPCVAQSATPSSPAAGGAVSPPDEKGAFLVERSDELLVLVVQPLNDGMIGMFVSSQAPQCRFPEAVFELPIQVNRTGFQLKHAIRPTQNRERDGSCTETIATSYQPEHYWPLKTATAVALHLPWAVVPLGENALAHLRTQTPVRPAEKLPVDGTRYVNAINQLVRMLSSGEAGQARQAAEALLPAFATRPPDEGFPFFATLGMARRMTGDLAFAASSLEVATQLAAMTNAGPNVGVVYDNLATVRQLQKRWTEAEQASDRAIAALEAIDEPPSRQALAGVYNNRALVLVAQEQYESALAYSEKALAILKVTFANDQKQLAPFLDDNRQIREKLNRR